MESIPEPRAGVWVVAQDPSTADINRLHTDLGFNIDLLKDAVDPFEAPRVEKDEGIVYIYARVPHAPQKGASELATVPVLVAIADSAVLTACQFEMPFLDPVIKSLDTATTQKVRLVLMILDTIIRTYSREITTMRKDVRRYYVNPQYVREQDIFRFVELESKLNDYTSSLVPLQDVFTALERDKVIKLFEEDADLLEDLRLSAEQLITMGTSTLRTITNLREAYGVVAANKLNRVIRLLTVLTVVLTIPTIVTSFFGMNVPLPFAHSAWAWVCIIVGSLGVSGGLLWLFNNQRWV
jgi:magnesium transporter